VLGEHCKSAAGFPSSWDKVFAWLFDGNLGVRFFFIICGFLITWLLVREHDRTGRVNLKHFYARRALRILPVYAAFMGLLLTLALVTPLRQSMMVWIGNLTFTTDFIPIDPTSGYLWSLSVEEQFYLFWPGILILFKLAERTNTAWFILAVPLLLAPIFRVVSYLMASHLKFHPEFLGGIFYRYSFFNYFDSLAVGCACAILLARKRGVVENLLKGRTWSPVWLALVLILTPYILGKLFLLGALTVPFGQSLEALGFAILLLHSIVLPEVGFYRALNWRWVRWIGVLSYSIYIWQQIFCAEPAKFGLTPVWWMSFPGWLVPALGVAMISYYGLERPLFSLRSHFRD
jgi:peptidoglycan/LPS O-acetylase OafA/YrhL